MKFIKIIVFMVVVFSVAELWAEETSPSNMDDTTLLQYALKLQKNQHELFAGAQGVLVMKIVPNSQAEKKGLQRGDIVVGYNEQPMNSAEQLVNSVQANAAEPQMELRLIRAGILQTVVLQGGRIGISLTDISQELFYRSALDRLQEEGEKAYYKFDYQMALEKWETALQQAREIGDKRYISPFLGNLGMVYSNLGQNRKALDYYQQALAIFRELGDKLGVGKNLNNLGVVYDDFGQYRKALDYYQQALVIFRAIGNKGEIGNNLTNLGVVSGTLGQNRKALDYFQQALAIFREIGDKPGVGINLSNLGMVYKNFGNYRKALNYCQQALAIARELGDKRGEYGILGNLGVMYLKFGQYEKAKTHFQNSIILLKKFGVGNYWKAFGGLASTEVKLNQFDTAISHYEEGIDNIEKLREGLVKEQKLSFMQNKWFVYDEFIALLQMLHKKHPNKSYDHKALKIFERKQGRIFLEEMGESGARRFAGVAKDISQRDRELEEQIAVTRKHRNEALAEGKDAKPHRKQLEKLQAEQANFEKTLQIDYPAYYALKYPKPVALENLQQDVLQAGELMLIYNVRKESTDLWIVGKQDFSLFNLPLTEKQIQQKVTKFREIGIESMLKELKIAQDRQLKIAELKYHLQDAVADSLPEFVKVSHGLYQQLSPEAARELIAKAETLYVVPTGGLYKLPFEALVTVPDEEEPHYLIQDSAITYLSSASLLKTLRDAGMVKKKHKKGIKAIPLLFLFNSL